MYQVTVKGRTIEELKHAVGDIHRELSGQTVVTGLDKIFDEARIVTVTEELHAHGNEVDDMEEVESPFAPVRVGEADSEGIPWNSKIHASSKAKNADGTWRVKRGVEKALVAEYKAEFKNTSVPPTVPVSTPAAVSTPTPASPVQQPSVPVAQPAASAATPATLPPMPTMNAGHTLQTFTANFPTVVANLINEKKLDQNYINDLCKYFDVTEIWKVTDEQKAMMFAQWTSPEFNIIQKVG